MAYYICTTCGTQFPESENPPSSCPICSDQRQYIGHNGQQWTTLPNMQAKGMHNRIKEYEPGLTGIGTEPPFAIGERALLVQTNEGNVLWDCITYLDDETIKEIQQRGGLQAIAISHPHFYSTMIEWANQFDAPIYLHEANRKWVMRPDPRISFWSGETHVVNSDITLVRLGGHFTGSTVLHWKSGAEGKGALLTGDTIQVVADRNRVSFMYSYPNQIPLPASVIRHIRDTIAPYPFERLYGGWFDAVVASNAHHAVQASANRYIEALDHRLS